jgi:hypothetical protein
MHGQIPVPFALEVAAWHLKQAVWTIIRDNFFSDTAWTADLVTVLAVQKIFQRVQAVV